MMRIQKIVLNNYRQYKNLTIKLDNDPNKQDLHVFIGHNDTGKTNLLNAINWCLYEDEPHLGKQKEEMPLLNTKTINEFIETGADIEVSVVILTTTDNSHKLKFERKHLFRIHQNNKTPMLQESDFEITHTFPSNKTETYSKEKAQEYVDKFIPRHLREFFFFDGEEIKTYFQREKAKQIRKHVFDLSNINLMQRVEKRLKICQLDIRKELSKQNPKMERIELELEGCEKKIESLEELSEKAFDDKEKAKEKILELDKSILGAPDPDEIQEKINNLVNKRKEKTNKKDEFIDKKRKLLVDSFILLNIHTSMRNVEEIVKIKRKKKEIPPPYDLDEIEVIVNEQWCKLCDRSLDKKAIDHVNEIKKSIEENSLIGKSLTKIHSEIQKKHSYGMLEPNGSLDQ